MVYGIIGVGAIAEAIVEGLCSVDVGAPAIVLSPRNAEIAADLEQRYASVTVAEDNQAVIDRSSVVILAVRPQDAAVALKDLVFPKERPVISLLARTPLAQLSSLVAPATKIARAIPLPPVRTRSGITPVFPAGGEAKTLFDRLGSAVELPSEESFEAFATASATVAAHFAYLDTIAGWLTAQNVPQKAASQYMAAVFAGVAGSLHEDKPDFERLAKDHATPGGINEAFLTALTSAGVFDKVKDGLETLAAKTSLS
ncbi:NAD(P)-binding domain-containing protein [Afifella sp. JA880]|uniref:NAD(P)-binding domain-containing protein n=1 Tax=Afifella sp. JA880 TaxID=2975280 RepID=UPI0021BA6540|nr:NAD(P)-binding domain-containing protein [Afifella sp. JA880]MCT8268817.1 NAD(P)-binding domain-containing protein [Afifella sp. JA880]